LDEIQSLGKQNVFEEGGVFVLTNAPASMWVLLLNWLKTGSTIIPADATSVTDLENLVDQKAKIDFVLHSIGMSVNVRKGNHYTNQNYEYTEKGWNVSAVSKSGIV
jgi:enoyl-[acyl-carrier protein] reductase I